MSRATIFVALQCCECSTMQVKQQKKSSNKWTCVVCNQKQSVRKVFALGSMAKDLRKFVQSFNMSRKHADENPPPPAGSDYVVDLIDDDDRKEQKIGWNQNNPRTDWTEYLDLDNHLHNQQDRVEDDTDPKIVTEEITNEMFKRPKLRDSYAPGRGKGFSYKPVFAERNIKSQDDRAVRPEMGINTRIVGDLKWTGYNVDTEEPGSFRAKMARASSKWDYYVTRDSEGSHFGSQIGCGDQEREVGNELLQTGWDDLTVEDEVHPDFM